MNFGGSYIFLVLLSVHIQGMHGSFQMIDRIDLDRTQFYKEKIILYLEAISRLYCFYNVLFYIQVHVNRLV